MTKLKHHALYHKDLMKRLKMSFSQWCLFLSTGKPFLVKEDGVMYEHTIGKRNGVWVHNITAHHND